MGTGEAHEIHFFRDPDAPNGIGDERTFQAGGSAFSAGALDQARGFLGPVFGLGCATDVEGYEDRAGALRIPANAQAGP